ncbi:MAG: hypothetical protein ACR2L9_11200 [Solirubrobacteraceae bacterium]
MEAHSSRARARRWLMLFTGALSSIVLALSAAGASASSFLPPGGRVFQGVAGQPISTYEQLAGKHPAVYQIFSAWGEYLPGIFQDAQSAHARLMIMISTQSGTQEMITPQQIAQGDGDAWLIAMNRAMYGSGLVTYVRLMAEMDAYWNDYSAYNADGSYRGKAHSQAAYRNAWRRVTLILRGGKLPAIDAQLRRLRMPPLRAGSDLPQPKVAMLWVPQTSGAPDVRGNQPSNYWPGRQWVNWVGTDFYGKFPNFSGLSSFYNSYRGFPFVFGEWALWGADDPGFVGQLFGWVGSHPRTRMLIYNQGVNPAGPLRLTLYPRAASELRRRLASPRFPAFAPEFGG